MSAMDLVAKFDVEPNTAKGPCPVCHQKGTCRRWWSLELREGKWKGTLFVTCHGFPRDREQLAEHLNRYHVRPEGQGGTREPLV